MPQSPQVSDTAPDEPFLTGYDMAHLVTYLRLLDADAEGADWREVAAIVLELDVAKDPKRARRSWASHLGRFLWNDVLREPLQIGSGFLRQSEFDRLPCHVDEFGLIWPESF